VARLKEENAVINGDESEEPSGFFNFVRWILFIPASLLVSYIFSQTGVDFVVHFVSTFAGALTAAFVAPRGRIAIALVYLGVAVLPLLIPLFAAMYNSTQIVYMVVALVLAIGCVVGYEKRKKHA
jgi:hypothetical protein